MFGAYVFEGNQIVQVVVITTSLCFSSVTADTNIAVVIVTSLQSKRDANCLAEATFTSGHRCPPPPSLNHHKSRDWTTPPLTTTLSLRLDCDVPRGCSSVVCDA